MSKRIKLPTTPLTTKAGLKKFVEKYSEVTLPKEAVGLFNSIKALWVEIEKVNGRAQEARDKVAEADLIRVEFAKVIMAETAPKKKNVQAAKNAKGKGKAKSAAKSREPTECLCGCGELTNGGVFKQGHDARLKSRYKKGERLNKLQTLYMNNMGQWETRPRTLAAFKKAVGV